MGNMCLSRSKHINNFHHTLCFLLNKYLFSPSLIQTFIYNIIFRNLSHNSTYVYIYLYYNLENTFFNYIYVCIYIRMILTNAYKYTFMIHSTIGYVIIIRVIKNMRSPEGPISPYHIFVFNYITGKQ